MTDSSDDRVVVATQFSRLRKTATDDQAPQVDLAYEALAALSEVMDVLAEMLTAKAEGRSVCDDRRQRIAERAEILVEQVRRLSGSDAAGAAAAPAASGAPRDLPAPEPDPESE